MTPNPIHVEKCLKVVETHIFEKGIPNKRTLNEETLQTVMEHMLRGIIYHPNFEVSALSKNNIQFRYEYTDSHTISFLIKGERKTVKKTIIEVIAGDNFQHFNAIREILYWLDKPHNELDLTVLDPGDNDHQFRRAGVSPFQYEEDFGLDPSWALLLMASYVSNSCNVGIHAGITMGLEAYGISYEMIKEWNKRHEAIMKEIADVTDIWFEYPDVRFADLWEQLGM